MIIKSIMLAIPALILSTSVNAALVYDENIDGDIDLSNLGAFGVGLNTITGATSWDSSGFDFDNFIFTISAGTQVSSFLVDFTTTGSLTSTNDFGVFSGGGLPTSLFNFTIGASSGGQVDILALAGGNLGPGSYAIQQTLFGQGAINYTYSVDVNAVPVPAAVWLFGSGLLGLIGVARRRKTAV